MTATSCPFLDLCERDFVGPALSDEEQVGLQDHLTDGCPSCEDRIEEHLSGSREDDALSASVRELNELVTGAVDHAGAAMDHGRLLVLAKVQNKITQEELELRRRWRRRAQRAVLYVSFLVLTFVLLAFAFVGTLATRTQRNNARTLATKTELMAMRAALARYVKDKREVPDNMTDLLRALLTPRTDRVAPYYPVDPRRVKDAGYLDDFNQPYRFLARPDRALIYSAGANGTDEGGEGDDLGEWVQFAHK